MLVEVFIVMLAGKLEWDGCASLPESIARVSLGLGTVAKVNSSELNLGLHGEPALVVLRPQARTAAICRRRAADPKGVQVGGRSHRAKAEAGDTGLGPLLYVGAAAVLAVGTLVVWKIVKRPASTKATTPARKVTT